MQRWDIEGDSHPAWISGGLHVGITSEDFIQRAMGEPRMDSEFGEDLSGRRS